MSRTDNEVENHEAATKVEKQEISPEILAQNEKLAMRVLNAVIVNIQVNLLHDHIYIPVVIFPFQLTGFAGLEAQRFRRSR